MFQTAASKNILVLLLCWLFTAGAGAYFTYVLQPAELERLEKSVQVGRLKEAEVSSLLAEAADTEEQARDIVARWNARYKAVPASISSPDVIGYLNDLTQTGFENFDLGLEGITRTPDFSYYTFNVSGRGYFSHLYEFVWEVENNRLFYRLDNLKLDHIDLIKPDPKLGTDRMQVMVSFDFKVHAYFGSAEGMNAAEGLFAGDDVQPLGPSTGLPPVPEDVLPDRRPDINPFFPVVMSQLPPNTYGHVDLEKATLVAIVGDQAIFHEGDRGTRRLGVGDPVYLGQIVAVDATEGRVRARLNKGGIIDEVELELHTGDRYRQAFGPVQLTPATE